MQVQWTLQDAKNKFSEVVNAACLGTPQFVTKRGEPAVVVLSTKEYQRLIHEDNSTPPLFGDFLLSMPQENQEMPSFDEDRGQLHLREVEF